MQSELIYGVWPVLLALRAQRRRFAELFLLDGEKAREPIAKLAAEQGITVKHLARGELNNLCPSAVHQGVAARVSALHYEPLHSLPDGALWLALDRVEDPMVSRLLCVLCAEAQNLGAMIRSAQFFGVSGVVCDDK